MNTIDPITKISFSIYENKGVYALLLGSGISRSAEIPTGWDITLNLIERIAKAEEISGVDDWEAWYKETKKKVPSYSNILEELASTTSERRSILNTYIEPTAEEQAEGKKIPTVAHYAIAELVSKGFIKVILTTNFDRLLESALQERGITPTVVASVDALKGAEPLAHSYCYILKLHGDYKDNRILNTEEELAKYRAPYKKLLARIFDEYGLIVCGWSGEWDEALRSELLKVANRRYSTFWTTINPPTDKATALINHRKAQVIEIESADAFFTKVNKQVQILETTKRENPANLGLLKATVKQYLSKPDEYKIQLEDLMQTEMEQLIQTTNTEEFATQHKPYLTWEVLQALFERYNAIAERLVLIAGMIGRWGTSENHQLFSGLLQEFYNTIENSELINDYRQASYYPLGLIYTAYGIGLVKAKQWEALKDLFFLKADDPNNDETALVQRIIYNLTHKEFLQLLPKYTKAKQPYSDYLFQIFTTQFDITLYGLKSEFEELFDWFELYQGMAFFQNRKNKHFYVGRNSCCQKKITKYTKLLNSPNVINTFTKAGFIENDSDTLYQKFLDAYTQECEFNCRSNQS